MTNKELEDYLWKYGVKDTIADIETQIYKGGVFFESMPPPKSLLRLFSIETLIYKGSKVYTILPKKNKYADTIYYIHGGGFTCGVSKIQWDMIAYLARTLNYRIIVPDYPLLPHVSYREIYNFILDVYKFVCDTESRIFTVGDSAGASLVLGLSQLIDTYCLRKPSHQIVISPWMDVSMTNTDIASIQPVDPTLDVSGLNFIAKLYSDGDCNTNPLVSPLYGDYRNAAPITLITGTRDILYPDCKLFYEQCKAKNISLSYYEYKDMVHVFPLFDTPQGNEVKQIIVNILRDNNEKTTMF